MAANKPTSFESRNPMRIPATLVRGGTSKCWLFDSQDVPASRDQLETLLIDTFNAADPRQIDGVGGGTSTTSKAAVISAASEDDVDVNYLFAQVGIGDDSVEWGSNCGNCATAIALYAVDHGFVHATSGITLVRMRNLNTGTRLEADVTTPDGKLPAFGDAQVPGTLATGVPVTLAFLDPAGGSTGSTLPTQNACEELSVGGQRFLVSMIDAGAPMVLVAAESLGLHGSESLADLSKTIPVLTEIRNIAAVRMGLRGAGSPVNHAVPKVGIVGPPADFFTTAGQLVSGTAYDVSVRTLSMHTLHPAIGLTSAVGIATAAITAGTVVSAALAGGVRLEPSGSAVSLRIGTAAGVIATVATLNPSGHPIRIGLERAARVISESIIFTRETAAVRNSA
ncbi:PrpF domain-containing protein [Arthrobacter sp. 08Y14]|uniref:PrpF domain-containing protein n=1 Tax=Arthrobacter sp. 08Y14 TaxID=2058885 RepID=UPI001CA47AFC|nr:PrpF domain-containing protein [Arthrobacter sp. 08Y14]